MRTFGQAASIRGDSDGILEASLSAVVFYFGASIEPFSQLPTFLLIRSKSRSKGRIISKGELRPTIFDNTSSEEEPLAARQGNPTGFGAKGIAE
jgi:hypothetical protein